MRRPNFRPSEILPTLCAAVLTVSLAIACGGQEGASDGSGELAPGTGDEFVERDPAAPTPGTGERPTKVEEIVALFPKDLPEWDAATLTDAVGGKEGEGVQTLEANVPPIDAAAFYKENLGKKGWEIGLEKTVEDFTMIEFHATAKC